VREYRKNLFSIIPQLKNLELKEYGYHVGVVKNKDVMHTHSNPVVE
jgi:hypothetical protein